METSYFSHIAKKIRAAKENADALASRADHHGIEGEIREIALRTCVEPFLTQSYKCGTGKIIDSLGQQSRQVDLAVYHTKVAPPILVSRDLGFFPVECVRYVFEVKSRLTAVEIKDANDKFASVARLTAFPRKQPDGTLASGRRPTTVLFAFCSDIQSSEIDRYIKYSGNGHPPCVVLCVLGKCYWWYDAQSGIWRGIEASSGTPPYREFCIFMAGFMNTLAAEETSLMPFRPGAYVLSEDGPFELTCTATSHESG